MYRDDAGLPEPAFVLSTVVRPVAAVLSLRESPPRFNSAPVRRQAMAKDESYPKVLVGCRSRRPDQGVAYNKVQNVEASQKAFELARAKIAEATAQAANS